MKVKNKITITDLLVAAVMLLALSIHILNSKPELNSTPPQDPSITVMSAVVENSALCQ